MLQIKINLPYYRKKITKVWRSSSVNSMFDPEEKICDIIAEARPDANAFEKAIRQAGANDDYYNVFCRIPKIASD